MTRTIHIFVGPIKTGTTWLHSLRDIGGPDKEIRFPARFGRSMIYRKYVADEDVLIWPYLLHEPDSLFSLINACESDGRTVRLYASVRKPSDWRASLQRFSERATNVDLSQMRDKREATIRATLQQLKAGHDLTCLRMINPRARDIDILSQATGVPRKTLETNTDKVVFATRHKSRFNLRFISVMFFRVKPFLPRPLRGLRRGSGVWRHFFFR
jgi:hypothetical protein